MSTLLLAPRLNRTQSRVFLKLIGKTGEHGEVELGTKFKKGRFVGKCPI